MVRGRCRRRKVCPECGARAVLVRYEPVPIGGPAAVRAPVVLRCTSEACPRYWL